MLSGDSKKFAVQLKYPVTFKGERQKLPRQQAYVDDGRPTQRCAKNVNSRFLSPLFPKTSSC